MEPAFQAGIFPRVPGVDVMQQQGYINTTRLVALYLTAILQTPSRTSETSSCLHLKTTETWTTENLHSHSVKGHLTCVFIPRHNSRADTQHVTLFPTWSDIDQSWELTRNIVTVTFKGPHNCQPISTSVSLQLPVPLSSQWTNQK